MISPYVVFAMVMDAFDAVMWVTGLLSWFTFIVFAIPRSWPTTN